MLTKEKHAENLAAAAKTKADADDMAIVAEELKQLPPGQLKKLQASKRLTAALARHGVSLE